MSGAAEILAVIATRPGRVRAIAAPAKGRHMKRSPTLRAVNRSIDVHMTIAAPSIFNVLKRVHVRNCLPASVGREGDVNRRRAMTADMVMR